MHATFTEFSCPLQNQRLFDEQTSKLKQLEAAHRETGRRLKDRTTNNGGAEDGELEALSSKYHAERDELETLRRAIDDLEFQMFEVRGPIVV
jgi:hypothetical protein